MAKKWSSLIINSEIHSVIELEYIFGVKSLKRDHFEYQIYEDLSLENSGLYEYPIDVFFDLIETKYKLLTISDRDSIEIWILYEYDDQCGFEFSPDLLSKFGKFNVTLCINAYQFDENQDNWIVRLTD